jgi:hypothetical protein
MPTSAIEDYVFTVELRSADVIVAHYTGVLSRGFGAQLEGNDLALILWQGQSEFPEWCSKQCGYGVPVRLKLWVSTITTGVLSMVMLYDQEGTPKDNIMGLLHTMGLPADAWIVFDVIGCLPMKQTADASFFIHEAVDIQNDDNVEDRPGFRCEPKFYISTQSGYLTGLFRLSYNNGFSDLTERQTCIYLEFIAPFL